MPAIAYVLDMYHRTNGAYGVNEVILASAMVAIIFPIFSVQPLTFVGVTGLINLVSAHMCGACQSASVPTAGGGPRPPADHGRSVHPEQRPLGRDACSALFPRFASALCLSSILAATLSDVGRAAGRASVQAPEAPRDPGGAEMALLA